MFTDDTKAYNEIKKPSDYVHSFAERPDQVGQLVQIWILKFNALNCATFKLRKRLQYIHY